MSHHVPAMHVSKKYFFWIYLKRLINFILFSLQITQTTKRLKRQLLREEWCHPPPNTHVHCLVLQALLKQLLPGWAQHRWYRVARQIIVIRARPLQIQTHCGVTLVKRDRYYQAHKVVQPHAWWEKWCSSLLVLWLCESKIAFSLRPQLQQCPARPPHNVCARQLV